MSFHDYPFMKSESDPRMFPGHDEVLRFLDRFVEEFGVKELTRFETRVVRVERGEEGWVVETLSRGSEMVTREVYEAVVVCSGHNSSPRVAEILGIEKWSGFQMHSHNYRVPQPFRDQVHHANTSSLGMEEIYKLIYLHQLFKYSFCLYLLLVFFYKSI